MSITRSRSVIISDLSARGAMIGGRDLPSPGDDLLMVVGTQDRMGTVKWRAADKCGVQLDEALANDNIELMKQEAAWESVAGWDR